MSSTQGTSYEEGAKPNGYEKEINELEGKINELDKHLKESKKKWYKDAGLWISIIAVSFSIYTGLHDIFHQSAADIKAKREEISGAVLNLIQVEFDYNNDKIVKTNQAKKNAYLDKFNIILSKIDMLEGMFPNMLSRSEYDYVANAYDEYTDQPDKCAYFYAKELMNSHEWFDSSIALRNLALSNLEGGSTKGDNFQEGIKNLCLARSIVKFRTYYIANKKVDGFAYKNISDIFGEMAFLYSEKNDKQNIYKYLDSSKYYINKNTDKDWRSEAISDYNSNIQNINDGSSLNIDTLKDE